jgi:hypothetical protein
MGGVRSCAIALVKGPSSIGGRVRGFGALEAVIMDRLWGRERKTTVRDVFGDLRRERQIA